MILILIILYIHQFIFAILLDTYIVKRELLKTIFKDFSLHELFMISIIPVIGILFMVCCICDIIQYTPKKENKMKILTVCRKLLKIHYVENIPCYVVDGKIHQLPKLEREDAKLYLVSESDDRNKVSRVEITYEE